MNRSSLIAFAVIACTALATLFVQRFFTKREAANFHKRKRLSDEQIYDIFYKNSGLDRNAVLDAWHDVARCLRVDPGLVRPEDGFGRSVGRNWLTNWILEDVERSVIRRARLQNRNIDLSAIGTVDDFVKTFASNSPT